VYTTQGDGKLDTLVIPDRDSTCIAPLSNGNNGGNYWEIALDNGEYWVETSFCSTTYEENPSGCSIEGHTAVLGLLPMCTVANQAGAYFSRWITVSDGRLTFAGIWAWGCRSVNHIHIQNFAPG
jgi:hypothetical protein